MELTGNLKQPNNINLENINVICIYKNKTTSIYKINYKQKDYKIEKMGLQYKQNIGSTLYHIFGVSSKESFFKICLNTQNLQWKLLEQNSIN